MVSHVEAYILLKILIRVLAGLSTSPTDSFERFQFMPNNKNQQTNKKIYLHSMKLLPKTK